MRRRTLALASLTLALAGCSGNTITDSQGRATGLKFYNPRPVVLPVGTAVGDTPMPLALRTIPDLRCPQYVELGSGLGESGMELTMIESERYVGYAATFEQLKTKQNVPKAITSITNGAATIIGAVAVKNAVEK